MQENITLAELLSAVFERLEKNIPKQPGANKTLFQAWKDTLGSNQGLSDLLVVENIGRISSSMIKLQNQVKNSKRFNDIRKRSALLTIQQFEILFELNRFQNNSQDFKSVCSEKNCGDLGILGLGLSQEFSEPKISTDDANEISDYLKDVKKSINEIEIPIDLKLSLEKIIDLLIWWLSNSDIASAQDIFESLGSAAIISRQIEINSSSKEVKEERPISSKIQKAIGKISFLMGLVNKGFDFYNNVEHLEKILLPH